jgi:hypothetical protein
LTNPQLVTVTDNQNEAKGDKGPEEWVPPLGKLAIWTRSIFSPFTDISAASYHCTYAEMWVKVKSVYDLTITAAEKSALSAMLGTC